MDNMKPCPKCDTLHNKSGTFCSRTCANSRTWTEEDKKKKSESVKRNFAKNGHPRLGKLGWKHTEEQKLLKSKIANAYYASLGRTMTPEKLALKNRVTASRYRAKQRNAIPLDADKKLIKKIYEHRPKGYEVDHIISLAEGGLHHQDNLQYLPNIENKRKGKTQNYDKSLVIRWQDIIYTIAE
jgi:hypothetical protein